MKLPDLEELVALRGAAHGLGLRALRPVLSGLQGSHHSGRRGRGLEFEEVRLYASGDDVRNIDWRVTARRGRPHTKLYREERERPVWLLADLHAGLFFGSRRQFKSALLLRAAALLGWVAAEGGDRVGAVIVETRPGVDGALRILPPRGREAGVLPVLQSLVAAQPCAPGLPDPASLGLALHSLRPLLQPGSLVLVMSDFSGLDDNAASALAGISLHNDCRLLRIADPLESAGLPAGNYRVGLPGKLWWLDGERSRPAWHAAWMRREHHLDAVADRLGLPLVRLSTADDVVESLPPLLREAA